jgi:hypothetical protein
MASNAVENARARKRIHGTATPPLGRMQVKLLPVAHEIMEYAEAQLALLLGNGGSSGNSRVVKHESDGTRAINTVIQDYNWRPDDVLCLACFRATFSGLYYAWWLEERRTNRVEGELLYLMTDMSLC